MKSSAFILLEPNPINNLGLDVLTPLLKTQGIEVAHGEDPSSISANTKFLFIEASAENAWLAFSISGINMNAVEEYP